MGHSKVLTTYQPGRILQGNLAFVACGARGHVLVVTGAYSPSESFRPLVSHDAVAILTGTRRSSAGLVVLRKREHSNKGYPRSDPASRPRGERRSLSRGAPARPGQPSLINRQRTSQTSSERLIDILSCHFDAIAVPAGILIELEGTTRLRDRQYGRSNTPSEWIRTGAPLRLERRQSSRSNVTRRSTLTAAGRRGATSGPLTGRRVSRSERGG